MAAGLLGYGFGEMAFIAAKYGQDWDDSRPAESFAKAVSAYRCDPRRIPVQLMMEFQPEVRDHERAKAAYMAFMCPYRRPESGSVTLKNEPDRLEREEPMFPMWLKALVAVLSLMVLVAQVSERMCS